MTQPVIRFHHLDQARAAFLAVKASGASVRLVTTAGAAAFAGPAYLKRAVEIAEAESGVAAECWIDCGEDAGDVFKALRAGWRRIVFASSHPNGSRIVEIADTMGALILDRAGLSLDSGRVLDLGDSPDLQPACEDFLSGCAPQARSPHPPKTH